MPKYAVTVDSDQAAGSRLTTRAREEVEAIIAAIPPKVVDYDDLEDVPESFPPSAHTHQEGDISGLEAELATHEKSANKGVANGYVPLDGTVHIPAAFIPGSVDDIIEEDTFADFPQPGLTGKIYVALDTGNTYRWSGTQYTEIAASPGSTDAVPEGVTNLYYTDVRAKAAAASSYETRVAAAESHITAIDATNTAMSADVSTNSSDIVDLKNNKVDTATLNAVQGVLAGLIAEKANSNDPRFDLAVSAVQPDAFGAALLDLRNQLLFTGAPLDDPSPLHVTVETLVTNATHNSTIDGGAFTYGAGDPVVTAIGGDALVQDVKTTTYPAYCFQWRFAAGTTPVGTTPAINQGAPWPRAWSVQFDVVNSPQIEFIVFDYGGTFNLVVDGQVVFPFPQPSNSGGTTAAPKAANIKFTLPDAGLHRIRFNMGNMSLEKVCVADEGTILPRKIYSPRIYFIGDGVSQGQNSSDNFSERSSWIHKFGEMVGIYDVWNDSWRGWGPITGGAASHENRALVSLPDADPEVVFIQGYMADLALDPDDVAAAWGRTIDNAHASTFTPPMVFCIGSFDPTGGYGSAYVSMDAAIRAVCAEKGVGWIEPTTDSIYGRDGSVVQAGNAPWFTVINRLQYLDPIDQTRLSLTGQLLYAYKVYTAVRAILDATVQRNLDATAP